MRDFKFGIILFFSLLFVNQLEAQSYNTALGLRFGSDMGMTVQQRIGKKVTLEGIAQYNRQYDESAFTALLEHHMPLILKRFNIYAGVGGHYVLLHDRDLEASNANGAGFSLVAGFELTIARINLSWDYKPLITMTGANTGFRGQSAISARYVLWKRKKHNKTDLKFWKKNPKKQKKRQKTRAKKQRQREKMKAKKV